MPKKVLSKISIQPKIEVSAMWNVDFYHKTVSVTGKILWSRQPVLCASFLASHTCTAVEKAALHTVQTGITISTQMMSKVQNLEVSDTTGDAMKCKSPQTKICHGMCAYFYGALFL